MSDNTEHNPSQQSKPVARIRRSWIATKRAWSWLRSQLVVCLLLSIVLPAVVWWSMRASPPFASPVHLCFFGNPPKLVEVMPRCTAFVVPESSGAGAQLVMAQEWDPAEHPHHAARLAMLQLRDFSRWSGVVGPVVHAQELRVVFSAWSEFPTQPPEVMSPDSWRTKFVDRLATDHIYASMQEISQLRIGAVVQRTWSVFGVLRDTLWIAGLCLLIACVSFQGKRFLRWQQANMERSTWDQALLATIRHVQTCRTCGYSLKGLATRGVTNCPECGEELWITNAWKYPHAATAKPQNASPPPEPSPTSAPPT